MSAMKLAERVQGTAQPAFVGREFLFFSVHHSADGFGEVHEALLVVHVRGVPHEADLCSGRRRAFLVRRYLRGRAFRRACKPGPVFQALVRFVDLDHLPALEFAFFGWESIRVMATDQRAVGLLPFFRR